jgi:hypothetical protein
MTNLETMDYPRQSLNMKISSLQERAKDQAHVLKYKFFAFAKISEKR